MHTTQLNLITEKLKQHFTENETVYDIGSFDVNGTHKDAVLKNNNPYIGCDIQSGRNVDIVINEGTWQPLNDNSIHYVISGSCLEHVLAPWKFAENLYRIVKPQGMCIICLPFKMKEHRYPVDCYRILPDGLKYLFSQHVKFDVVECGFTEKCKDTFIVLKKIN